MPEFDFREISKDDIQYILDIEEQSFSRPWSHESFANELSCNSAFSFAAHQTQTAGQNKIIAYLCFRIFLNEMHILKIAVENKWRRQGVASRLLEYYLKDACSRNAHAAFLEVRYSNGPAIEFYHQLGFNVIGRRPNYYSNSNNKEDALLMMKVLKEGK